MKCAAILALVLASWVPNIHADTVYTYTGNDFNTNQVGCAQFLTDYTCPPADCPTCFISGWLSTADPVAAAPFATTVSDVLDWSFTNGLETFTPADGTLEVFRLSTNPGGGVLYWFITLETSQGGALNTQFIGPGGEASDESSGEGIGDYLQGNPGVWTVTTPEPGLLWPLMAAALFAFIALRERRRPADRLNR